MAQTIRIGHSPDPDDAFMFYALTAGKVTIDRGGVVRVVDRVVYDNTNVPRREYRALMF